MSFPILENKAKELTEEMSKQTMPTQKCAFHGAAKEKRRKDLRRALALMRRVAFSFMPAK
jgi:hypothetical protein